jgi:cation transporter-like permease
MTEFAPVLQAGGTAYRRALRGLVRLGIARARRREAAMMVIVYYVISMIAGTIAAYFIGLSVEYEWGQQVSLITSLAAYVFVLWMSWLFAVWMTKPRVDTQSQS